MQLKSIAVGCAAALALSCVSFTNKSSMQVYAISQPGYGDFVDYLTSSGLLKQYYSLVFCYTTDEYDTYRYYKLFGGSADSYSISGDRILFYPGGGTFSVTCSGENSDGFVFSSSKGYSDYFTFGDWQGYLYYSCVYTAYQPEFKSSEPTVMFYVSNIDYTPDIFIQGDVDYADTWHVDVNMTPSASKDVVGKKPGSADSSGDSSGDGSGGFQLPDSWVNGGQTLETQEVTFPDGFDADSAMDAFDEVDINNLTSFSDGIGFFWALISKVYTSMDIWFLVFFSLLFAFLAWFLGR